MKISKIILNFNHKWRGNLYQNQTIRKPLNKKILYFKEIPIATKKKFENPPWLILYFKQNKKLYIYYIWKICMMLVSNTSPYRMNLWILKKESEIFIKPLYKFLRNFSCQQFEFFEIDFDTFILIVSFNALAIIMVGRNCINF